MCECMDACVRVCVVMCAYVHWYVNECRKVIEFIERFHRGVGSI